MFLQHSHYTRSSAGPEVRSSVHIPMVYETLAGPPLSWEYQVVSIDPQEEGVLDVKRLNALGSEGWVLTGLLDERVGGAGKRIHYYFMRQAKESE